MIILWNEICILWNEMIILWNEIFILWNEIIEKDNWVGSWENSIVLSRLCRYFQAFKLNETYKIVKTQWNIQNCRMMMFIDQTQWNNLLSNLMKQTKLPTIPSFLDCEALLLFSSFSNSMKLNEIAALKL